MEKQKDPILVAFGQALRDARKTAGLTQEKLADKAGLDRAYVGSVERGERNVALVNIVRLARALGVKPGALVNGAALGGDK
jgi:transcriptional regulator with XRE-family HTH domain